MKYLDPRADPTFYRVFGKHPSLLNALLPFDDDHQIKSLEYLPYDSFPVTGLSVKEINAL